LPDANYTREIPNLRQYDNVRLLGYVATTWANRNISLVRQDIQTYAAWPSQSSNSSLAVNGIFFDETPQQFDANALAFYQELTTLVKQSKGLGPENFVRFCSPCYQPVQCRTRPLPYCIVHAYISMQVIHNPGAVPDPRYLATADSTVVFEDTYDTFLQRNDANVFMQVANGNRSQLCTIIHSVPDDIQNSQLHGLVKRARSVADEVFVTHLNTSYYAGFGQGWNDFVDLMAAM
jgi:hypothetical protein